MIGRFRHIKACPNGGLSRLHPPIPTHVGFPRLRGAQEIGQLSSKIVGPGGMSKKMRAPWRTVGSFGHSVCVGVLPNWGEDDGIRN